MTIVKDVPEAGAASAAQPFALAFEMAERFAKAASAHPMAGFFGAGSAGQGARPAADLDGLVESMRPMLAPAGMMLLAPQILAQNVGAHMLAIAMSLTRSFGGAHFVFAPPADLARATPETLLSMARSAQEEALHAQAELVENVTEAAMAPVETVALALQSMAGLADRAAAPAGARDGAVADAAEPIATVEAAAEAVDARPQGLEGPRGGAADDLRLISGVGPKIEGILNGLGIFHFDQIAAWTDREVAWVDDHLRFSGRIARDNWIAQAATLAEGGIEAHRERFRKPAR
jgi:predicted flap endonuclease-1-like 5' DNA nuclease